MDVRRRGGTGFEVGFDDGTETERILDGAPVATIYTDFTGDLDLSAAHRLKENADLCFYGSQQKGSFDITSAKAEELVSKRNPFGLDTRKVVKPAINAAQLLRRAPATWVIDFGAEMPLDEAALYEAPFEYVKHVVYPERKSRSEKRQREYWWLHARPSPRYRTVLEKQTRYIASPVVSKHRVFVWLDSTILADHRLVVFAGDDDYFFGVLHSRPHEIWALRMGSTLEDRPSYTPSTTFETYPFPWPPGEEPADDPLVKSIAEAARELDQLRCRSLNPEGASEAELRKLTLTNLYNDRPTWLDSAHKKLDAAVIAAYGWPPDISNDEILKNLLALNLERSESD